VIAAVGRQSGKSDVACRVALHTALLRPDLDAATCRRKRRTVLIVAQGLAMSQPMLRHARDVLDGSPVLRGCLRRATSDELELRSLAGAEVTLRVVPASGVGEGHALGETSCWPNSTRRPPTATPKASSTRLRSSSRRAYGIPTFTPSASACS
jgi:hypothetical protein